MFRSPEVCVVEASAGSGKTYALAKRYVQLILHLTRLHSTPPIHAILAITFTHKAAFEMKERILKFLKELALGCMQENDRREILDPLGMTSQEAQKIARQVMDMILRHYNFFQVQTIDKFINSLLISSAFQIGFTANFRIKTSSREYLALALDGLIDEAGSNAAVRKAFDDFLTSMLLVESRSAWLPKDVVLDTMDQLFREYNTYAKDFVRGGQHSEDILKAKTLVLTDVRAFVDQMPAGVHATFAKSLRKFVEEHDKGFRFAQGLSAYFEPGKDIPSTKSLVLTPWHEDQWQKIQKGFVRAADQEVRHLYDPYIEIFARTRQKLVEACRREDIVFLSELNAKARLVYEEGMAPEELYYRLATRFEHYLFDEFQDTSVLQWENLRVLPEDAISTGGSLFYVGDKKQAIYSFRGGETQLFDDISAQYDAPGYHLVKQHLNTSRRSHAQLVNFNNEVFSLANLERFMQARNDKNASLMPVRPVDLKELVRVYEGARQEIIHTSPEGCVRVEVLQGAGKELVHADARPRVMERLKELRTRFDVGDIAILVRRNDEVEEVTRWLLEEGIPSSSERTLNIKEHALVAEVIAFLKFLASPVDDAAFGEFIQGRMFAAVSGISQDDLRDAVLIWRQAKREHLYRVFQRAFPLAWKDLIEDFFRQAGLYPVYETVSSFYRRMRVLENFPDDQGFLMHVLDLIKTNEEEFPDMAAFLGRYEAMEGEDLYVDVVSAEAVQVMTVHKAKGLEFRAVIIPFLTMTLQRGRSSQKKALNYTLRNTKDNGLALYHFNEHHTAYSTLADELSVEEKMGMFFSELNNVYVALTRAACEMCIFIPPRAGQSANLALHLIPEGIYNLGSPAASYPQKKADHAGTPCELNPPSCRDWIAFLKDEFKEEYVWERRLQRKEGEIYHAALAMDTDEIPDEIKHDIDRFKAADRVRPFFYASGAEVFVEKEFIDVKGMTRRMDRVLVFEKEVWVIDFKLTAPGSDRGRDQVQEYKKILSEIYPGRVIKGFLAFIKECQVVDV
jgi:ATP-dependent exoDNAse (exonuclease V) beta subunit